MANESNCMEPKGAADLPVLADVGVIALVPDVWGGVWQPRHHILSRLSRYFHVVWCNPAISWRRLWTLATRPGPGEFENASIPPGMAVYNPERFLPGVGRPRFIASWTMRQRLRRAKGILLARGCRKTILYIWRPHYAPAIDLIEHNINCYHIDDEYSFSPVEKPTDEREASLIRRASEVFIHSAALLEKKGHLNPRTLLVPNGVDYEAFATQRDEPEDLRPIPHPRMGYVGIIKDQLDLPLLLRLARYRREWSFVFVGPQKARLEGAEAVKELSSLPNVYFLGKKPVGELPGYMQHMDVCMLCYVVNDYTKYIYPLKLHEYLATGRPVVGAPIDSLQEFSAVVRLARTFQEWSEALARSLSPAENSADLVEARRQVAKLHDWNDLAAIVAQTLCSRLGPDYLARLERAVFRKTREFDPQVVQSRRALA